MTIVSGYSRLSFLTKEQESGRMLLSQRRLIWVVPGNAKAIIFNVWNTKLVHRRKYTKFHSGLWVERFKLVLIRALHLAVYFFIIVIISATAPVAGCEITEWSCGAKHCDIAKNLKRDETNEERPSLLCREYNFRFIKYDFLFLLISSFDASRKEVERRKKPLARQLLMLAVAFAIVYQTINFSQSMTYRIRRRKLDELKAIRDDDSFNLVAN